MGLQENFHKSCHWDEASPVVCYSIWNSENTCQVFGVQNADVRALWYLVSYGTMRWQFARSPGVGNYPSSALPRIQVTLEQGCWHFTRRDQSLPIPSVCGHIGKTEVFVCCHWFCLNCQVLLIVIILEKEFSLGSGPESLVGLWCSQ